MRDSTKNYIQNLDLDRLRVERYGDLEWKCQTLHLMYMILQCRVTTVPGSGMGLGLPFSGAV